jgi:hypothetical protein
LHGGLKGLDKVMWNAFTNEADGSVVFTYLSRDGDEGYPGGDPIHSFPEPKVFFYGREATFWIRIRPLKPLLSSSESLIFNTVRTCEGAVLKFKDRTFKGIFNIILRYNFLLVTDCFFPKSIIWIQLDKT